MLISEVSIGNVKNKPSISIINNDNDDILQNYLLFNTSGERIYIDYNIIDNIIMENLNINTDNHIDGVEFNTQTKMLSIDNKYKSLDIYKSPLTVSPNIISKYGSYDDILISIIFDNKRFSLLRPYVDMGECIASRYSKNDNTCSCVLKFNSMYNIVNRSNIILYDKQEDAFIKLVIFIKGRNVSIDLDNYDESEYGQGYNTIVDEYRSKSNINRSITWRLKFTDIATKYIVYNPDKIDKETLIRYMEDVCNITPILINWNSINTIDRLSEFLDKSMVARNVRSITFVGVDVPIPCNVFKNMKNVFFTRDIGENIACVKSN